MSDALRNKTVGQINAILKRFTEERAAEGHYSETEEELSDVDIVDESDNEYYVETEDEEEDEEAPVDDDAIHEQGSIEDDYDQEVVVSDGEQDDQELVVSDGEQDDQDGEFLEDDISDLEVSEDEYA